MAKQLNVNLAFTADTSKAKAQIEELSKSLNKITDIKPSVLNDSEIKNAITAANELKQHLQSAFDVDTGKLDLSKLSMSLSSAGKNLDYFKNNLTKIGSDGEKAFLQLTKSIASAQAPAVQVNKQLTEMWTTLKNTARWQISSSIMHGFMGAVSSAFGYAQDLNESLNEIRIVTDYNTEQMASFAKEANNAAKALSTTTTEYTNASLIYYQQGLSDEDVKARTDITIKMANAAGASAGKVSNQLTAVWNNFYDGTKSLEYYADVMTALGAATASSTDEIAGGLEKFAAIGETIGLSYEYAASALATITSNTRQSEEVVGTALKTIFARIQGLNLGETLDDGTTLNKYSEALQAIGISIFDTAGGLKDMDNILDEMAGKWDSLNKAQQTALAQTVAGTRQYTQLVSLMDNWDKGDSDSMVANLNTAYNSEGALQEQADIYAESWEAARDRVRAASEDIYTQLINDEFFIDLNNILADTINILSDLIDGFGGLGGIIGTVGGIFMRLYAKEMPATLQTLGDNLSVISGKQQKILDETQSKNIEVLQSIKIPPDSSHYNERTAEIQGLEQVATMKQNLVRVAKTLSNAEIEEYEAYIKTTEAIYNQVSALGAEVDASEKALKASKKDYDTGSTENITKRIVKSKEEIKSLEKQLESAQSQLKRWESIDVNSTDFDILNNEVIPSLKEKLEKAREAKEQFFKDSFGDVDFFNFNGENLLGSITEVESLKEALKSLENYNIAKPLGQQNEQIQKSFKVVQNAIEKISTKLTDLVKNYSKANSISSKAKAQAKIFEEQAKEAKEAGKSVESLTQEMSEYLQKFKDMATSSGFNLDPIQNEIDEVTSALSKGDIETAAQSFSALIGKFNEINVDNAAEQIENLKGKLGTLTGDSGLVGSAMEKLAKGAELSGEEIAAFNEAMAQLKGTVIQAPTHVVKLSESFTNLAGGLMQLSSLLSSIQSISEVFSDKDATAIDKITAAMGLLMTIISAVNGAMTASKSIYEITTKLSAKMALAKIAEGTANAASTGAIGANTLAWIANALAIKSHPIGWLATALIAVISAIGIYSAAIEANTKKAKENAEETQKIADASQELNQANRDNIATMADLLETYKTDKSVKGELDEVTRQLAEAYGLEGAALAKLSGEYGDYEGIYEDALEKQKEELRQVLKDTKEAQEDAGEVVLNTAREGRGHQTIDGKKYKVEFTGVSVGANEEAKALDAFEEYYGNDIFSLDETFGIGAGLSISTDLKAENIVDLYDELTAVRDIMQDTMSESERQNSGMYQQTVEWLDKMKKDVESYKELTDEINQIEIRIGDNLTLDESNIKSYQDFISWESQVMEKLTSAEGGGYSVEEAQKMINTLVQGSLNPNIQGYYDMAEGIAAIREEASHLSEGALTNIEDMYAKAASGEGEFDVAALAMVNWATVTEDNYLAAAEAAQKYYEAQKLATATAGIGEAQSIVSDGLDVDEYSDLEGAIAWGTEDIMEFNDFVRMSTEQQIEYLSALSMTSIEKTAEATRGMMESNQAQIDSLNEYLESKAARIEELEAFLSDETIEKDDTYYANEAEYAALQEQIDLRDKLVKQNESYQASLDSLATSAINSASSLSELSTALLFIAEQGLNVNYEDYANQLVTLAREYENCEEEIEAFSRAIESGNKAQAEAAEESLAAAIKAGELAEAYELSAEDIEYYAEALEASGKYTKANERSLTEMAKDQLRFDRAVNSAADNMEDWIKDLKVAEKTGMLVAETAEEMAAAYGDLLDIDDSSLSAQFLNNAENLKLMEEALNGSEEAYLRLQALAAQDILIKLGLDDEEAMAKFQADLDWLASYDVANLGTFAEIEVGADLNDEAFLAELSNLVNQAGMTAQQATDYLSSMGVDAEVVNEPETIQETVGYNMTPVPTTSYQMYSPGSIMGIPIYSIASYPGVNYQTEAVTQDKVVNATALKVTSASKSSGGGVKHSGSNTAHGASNSTKSTNKGGGGGSSSTKTETPQKADTVKKTEIVDRYKEVEDKLDDITDAADAASTAMDRLYGTNKIKKMQQVNALLQQEIGLLEQKKAEAVNYLAIDKAELQRVAAEAGVSFSFDEEGNIRNYETQMTALYNLLDAAIATANADGNATEEEQDAIDAIQEKIDAVKDAIAQYDETRELITDLDQEAQEKFNEWQDNNFEILNYTLELKLEVNDDNLQRLEYYIGKLEDDFYQMAESAALMVGNDGQWDQYTQNIEDYRAYLAKLKEDYEAGRISEDAYVEGVKEVKDGIYENLESLNELDKTMMEYYGETLAAAGEEIAKYTDLMEHQTSVLEHYNNVMELLNKQNDYAAMGVILEAQATLAENAVKVSQANYEMYAAEVAEREAALRAAQSRGASQAEIELLEQEWWAAQEAASEAQDQMISDVEAWAEAINAVLDNKLGSLAQALENSLTGDYGSFNEMTSAMERANSLQEEYLTTTNKVYETNKLMRTAQQEIDKTTNSLAKTRLKQFINETQQLQDQTELSQYELEIQQAKYDLLLAEIALEEAQAAKSTVRLQRDSEGNFGYVYTADESQIADAQQKLEDAQNSLYNIALEGANNYSQKYAETLREMNDTLIEINEAYRNGEYENEQEYQDALMAAREYYYEKMKQYSELYQVAIVTDGRVVEEAWSSEFANMTMETEQWMWAVDEYIANIRDAFSLWEEQMDRIADLTVGPDLDSLKEKVSGVVDVNTELADSITQDVIPGIQAEIDAVKKITSAYSLAREARLRYIRAGEQVANTAAQDLGEYIDNFDWSNTSGGSSSGNNSGNSDSSSNTGNGGSTSGGNGSGNESSSESGPLTWDRIMSAYNQIVSGAWGNGVANRIKRGVAAGYTEEEVRAAQKYINYTFPKNQNGYGYSKAKAKELLGFDTGGYTGDWAGSYGKLALLHKKELILEPGDTENFLDAMNILDRIVQMIDLQAMSSQFGGIMSAPGMSNMNNGVLEQMVHIEAHFEGATDRYEIEAAFDNLINRASQQANQK